MANLLAAKGLQLAYGYQKLLLDADFAVDAGEKVGLVGRNGCGKTSLMRILAGTEEPDDGNVARRKGVRVGYLPQDFELDETLTVGENIESGASDIRDALRQYEAGEGTADELDALQLLLEQSDGWNLDTRVSTLANSLDAPDLDSEVGSLSGGEKRRVSLCRALAGQPDLLLLDEPTNHLDSETIRWLEAFLHGYQGALIFVTHDRYFLDVIATRIVELDQGICYSHPGNYTNYLESKAIRQQIAEQSERRRQRFLREELKWVRAGVKARTTKSRSRLDKFYEVEGQQAPQEEREMDLLIPPPPPLGNLAVKIENGGAKVGEGADERWLFRGLDLDLEKGTCTGIVGRNGVGKTTLLNICLGERETDAGTCKIGAQTKFNFIDQNRMALDGSGSVLDEVSDGGEKIQFGTQTIGTRAYLRRFLFEDDRINEKVALLSGGEKARLMLAKVLCRGGNVLVLDEPTNDLDLPSLRLLEEALAIFPGTVLVVSHDRYFLDRICDQIVAFEDGGVRVHSGNYSYYLEKRQLALEAERKLEAKFKSETAKDADKSKRASRARKLSFNEQRELDGIEEVILEAEGKVEELEKTLNDPEFYIENADKAVGMTEDMKRAKEAVAELYVRWEELEEIRKASE